MRVEAEKDKEEKDRVRRGISEDKERDMGREERY